MVFAVHVFVVGFKMLSHGDSLLDEVIQIFWNFWSKSVVLQNSQDLGTSDTLYLGNTVLISKEDTDLGWVESLLGKSDNLVAQVVDGNFQPAWWSSSIREASSGDTFSIGIHSSHDYYFSLSLLGKSDN
eukprot:CAMPEP_0197003248 /NCGR_PEP_ID=MMETSP1380-20130617/7570_1 /TAXON_ID=5936 /ORGANISM="Euplotes crassus, Strain CT5" /LENGTH=128 /DNA_ID=CAMNT_0042421695 /DNA_START=36 /DNA_END=419 /DNA_ORIENTATION=-